MTGESRKPRQRTLGGIPGHVPAEQSVIFSGIRNKARIIVFIDESGLSERPARVKTWAPKGQTPVLQYHFNWHQLSVIAGISSRRFYFRLFPGAIKGPQVIEFLHALGQQIRQKLLVIWDGARFIDAQGCASTSKRSRVPCRSSRSRPMLRNLTRRSIFGAT